MAYGGYTEHGPSRQVLGVISPSGPSTHTAGRRAQFAAGLKTIEALGYGIAMGEFARAAESYRSIDAVSPRALDLHAMLRNLEVSAVVCANGGWNSSDLLKHVDWDLVRSAAKPIVGFSDITVLQNAAFAKTGVIQLSGPMVTWGFHKNHPETNRWFQQALRGEDIVIPTGSFGSFLRGSRLDGTLVGGNLVSLEQLLGLCFTTVDKLWDGKVLFWEETEESLPRLMRSFEHFANAGVFDVIEGMVIGHLDQIDGFFAGKEHPVLSALVDRLSEWEFPVMICDLFGHNIAPIVTMPIGGTISADLETVTLRSRPTTR